MLKIEFILGNVFKNDEKDEEKIRENIGNSICKSLIGNKCFIDNEVMVPTPIYSLEHKTWVQEIIIGDYNDHDLTIRVDASNVDFITK